MSTTPPAVSPPASLAELRTAPVAEVLAHVYRTNPYRYYAEACTLAASETR